ncbi:hypothetical protein, partial [Corallococcus aberystwythensis]|uniref:hypothetical protein n=1 Tax=Corallococcus aberystwythensis TaxID=2316722 RepID=UPI001ABFE91A
QQVVLREIHSAVGVHSESDAGRLASFVSGELKGAITVVDVGTISPLTDTGIRIEAAILEYSQAAIFGGFANAGRGGEQEQYSQEQAQHEFHLESQAWNPAVAGFVVCCIDCCGCCLLLLFVGLMSLCSVFQLLLY